MSLYSLSATTIIINNIIGKQKRYSKQNTSYCRHLLFGCIDRLKYCSLYIFNEGSWLIACFSMVISLFRLNSFQSNGWELFGLALWPPELVSWLSGFIFENLKNLFSCMSGVGASRSFVIVSALPLLLSFVRECPYAEISIYEKSLHVHKNAGNLVCRRCHNGLALLVLYTQKQDLRI